jgi:hypothetical protein
LEHPGGTVGTIAGVAVDLGAEISALLLDPDIVMFGQDNVNLWPELDQWPKE